MDVPHKQTGFLMMILYHNQALFQVDLYHSFEEIFPEKE